MHKHLMARRLNTVTDGLRVRFVPDKGKIHQIRALLCHAAFRSKQTFVWDKQQTERYDDEREKWPTDRFRRFSRGIRCRRVSPYGFRRGWVADIKQCKTDQAGVRDTDSKMLFKTD